METGEPGEITSVLHLQVDQKLGHGCAIVPLPATEETFVLVIHQSLLILQTVLLVT